MKKMENGKRKMENDYFIFAVGKNPHATPKLLNILNSSTFF